MREEKTLAQLASEYGVHPTQIRTWKTTALQELPQVFEWRDRVANPVAANEQGVASGPHTSQRHPPHPPYPYLLRTPSQVGWPTTWNRDQDGHFTSPEYVRRLEDRRIQISMAGQVRALDNIFTERLWRTVKSEEV